MNVRDGNSPKNTKLFVYFPFVLLRCWRREAMRRETQERHDKEEVTRERHSKLRITERCMPAEKWDS
eukprot:1266239-Amphidinium_carterae.1